MVRLTSLETLSGDTVDRRLAEMTGVGARRALAAVKHRVQGTYVMPPFNRVDSALAVLEVARDRMGRALRTSGDFDDYWQFHLVQEHERTHRSRYAGEVRNPLTLQRPHLQLVK